MFPGRVFLLLMALVAFDLSAALPSAGAEPAKSTSDWPHWRGPTGDDKSPLAGIREDWTGGLTRVWDADHLCLPPADEKEADGNF